MGYKCFQRVDLALRATKYFRHPEIKIIGVQNLDYGWIEFLENNKLNNTYEYCVAVNHKNCFCGLNMIYEPTLADHEFSLEEIIQLEELTKINREYFIYDFDVEQIVNQVCLMEILASIDNKEKNTQLFQYDIKMLFDVFTLLLYLNNVLEAAHINSHGELEPAESLGGNPFQVDKRLGSFHGISIRHLIYGFEQLKAIEEEKTQNKNKKKPAIIIEIG